MSRRIYLQEKKIRSGVVEKGLEPEREGKEKGVAV